jgi:aspartate/methionine/tyrosine aminotransferase
LRDRKRRERAAVLDLTQSNPTQADIPYPSSTLDALCDPRALVYEPDPAGLRSAREAVSGYYAARGLDIAADRIVLTASTSEAYSHLFKLLTDPGDNVLTPRPSYPLFDFLAGLDSAHAASYPLRYDFGWSIDFEMLEMAATPRTRAVVVVNPNNPAGCFLKLRERTRLGGFCAARGLAIVSDEVFSDYAFEPDAARVATLAGAEDVLTFSLNGLSKICGLPQMKLGWIVVSGPSVEASRAVERLELISDTYLSVAAPVQHALAALLETGAGIRAAIAARTRDNLLWLRDSLQSSAFHVLGVEGGWCATIRAPRIRSEEEWTLELLERHNVLVQPGFFFDFDDEAYLVVSLLTPPGEFREGVSRLLLLARDVSNP